MCILYKTEFNINFLLYIFNNLIFLWLKRPMGKVDIFGVLSGQKCAAYGQKMRQECATIFNYKNWCLCNFKDFH